MSKLSLTHIGPADKLAACDIFPGRAQPILAYTVALYSSKTFHLIRIDGFDKFALF